MICTQLCTNLVSHNEYEQVAIKVFLIFSKIKKKNKTLQVQGHIQYGMLVKEYGTKPN